jgi:hypothetical protein
MRLCKSSLEHVRCIFLADSSNYHRSRDNASRPEWFRDRQLPCQVGVPGGRSIVNPEEFEQLALVPAPLDRPYDRTYQAIVVL